MAYSTILRATLVFVSFISVSANCGYGTSIHPRNEVTVHVPVSTFSYSGIQGPIDWTGLNPANCACGNGKKQSPIVLDGLTAKAQSAPILLLPSVDEAELENLGTTLEVVMTTGHLFFNNILSDLKQFHFHTPSEHRIEEEYFPMEMHMVHQSSNGLLTVLAILFQLSEDGNSTTELISSVIQNLGNVTVPGTATSTGPLDFSQLVDAVRSSPLYQYSGSLTTPPCTEGVTFLVVADPMPLDVTTYNAMKKVLKYNARYTQNTPGGPNLLVVADNIANSHLVRVRRVSRLV
ncbi:carbonic anhydrase [Mycena sanguinolenta]|nr:carbonic anhydrase [Mycena sanguinolenta]